jgi:hypothetical protein
VPRFPGSYPLKPDWEAERLGKDKSGHVYNVKADAGHGNLASCRNPSFA